jgi:hypothetical protein
MVVTTCQEMDEKRINVDTSAPVAHVQLAHRYLLRLIFLAMRFKC